MIVVHTIRVQYLCKGGTNLLQRQFERLLASKQLKRPPEGDLLHFITYALPSISSVIHSYCKYQQVVCFSLLGVSAFQTEGVQVSHYTLTLLNVTEAELLGFLTTKQFKGKKRTLASDQSGKRKERNAAKKRRYENQTSTTFPLEAEDKGERYDFVLSCCERR